MKPNIERAALRCANVALACETVTTSVTLAGTDMREHGEDIRLLIAEAQAMAEVRKALYGELADSDGLMADPAQSIRERAATCQQQAKDLARASGIIRKFEENDDSFKRLADRELVIIASWHHIWAKDVHETLSEAVRRTVETLIQERDEARERVKGAVVGADEAQKQFRIYERELANLRQQLAERDAEYMRGAKLLALNGTEWKARAERLLEALQEQHKWHLEQKDRRPVTMGDTVGQIDAHEYADSEMCERTVAAITGRSPASIDFDRDHVGRMVRDVWINWAKEQPNPKPSWLVPFDQLTEADKEVDRRIGEVLAHFGQGCGLRNFYIPCERAFDLVSHLYRQRAFSERTFGPGERTAANLAHIRKELLEIEANPRDLTEWIDVALLAFDGAWRHGGTPESICTALMAKQTKNEGRTWPDWRTVPQGEAICHVEPTS